MYIFPEQTHKRLFVVSRPSCDLVNARGEQAMEMIKEQIKLQGWEMSQTCRYKKWSGCQPFLGRFAQLMQDLVCQLS